MNAFIRDGAPRPRKRRAERKVDRRHAKKKKRKTVDDGRRPATLSSSGRGENNELIVRLPVRRVNSVLRERRHNVDRHHDDAATSSRGDDAAAADAADDDDDDVVLVEPTWPTIDLTVAEDEDGARGHDGVGESCADQQPLVVSTECEDDFSYTADFIQATQTLLDDFEKIDDFSVNNELKNFLQSFDKNKKKQYLIKMLKQCYKETEGSLNKSMQMMLQIETKAYPLVVNEKSIISSSEDETKLPKKEEILNSKIRKQYLKLFGEEHLESDFEVLSQLPFIDSCDKSNIDVNSISVESEILEDQNMIDLDETDDICFLTKNSFGLTIRPKVTDGRTVVAHPTKCDNTSTKSYVRDQSSTNTSSKSSCLIELNEQEINKSDSKVIDSFSVVTHSITRDNISIPSNLHCKNVSSSNTSIKSSQSKESNSKEKQENHKSNINVTDVRSVVTHSITSDDASIQSNSHYRNQSSINMSTKSNELKGANAKEKQEKNKSVSEVNDDRLIVTHSITSDITSIQLNSHCNDQSNTNTFLKSSYFKEVINNKAEQEKNKSDSGVTNDNSVVTHSTTSDDASIQSNSHFRNQSSTNTSTKSSQLKEANDKGKQEKHKSDIKVIDNCSVVTHSITSNNISIQSNSNFRNESSTNMSSKIRHIVEVNVNEVQEESISDPDILNFIIDNNVEIVDTSDSEKLKFDQIVKKIQSKICKVVKPNDDIYKSKIIKELASYFSNTDFLNDFDFSLKTTESKLIGELIVKFFEKFNDTKKNMAHLSGCLICIFREISTKSYAPSDTKQHLILFLDFIKKFAKYYDNVFWKNWLSPKIFLDWCFVLDSIFYKNSSVISLNDESIWTNAMLYLKKIKRHKYVFNNCHTKKRKSSSGIFELTNSDDLLDINNDSSKKISEIATNLTSDETVAEVRPVPEHPKIAVCSEFSLSNSFKNDFCCMRVNDQKSKESELAINDLNIVRNDTLNISSDHKKAENPSGVLKDLLVTVNDKNQPTIIISGMDGNEKKNSTKRKNNGIPSQNAYYTIGNNPQKFNIACSSLPNCEQTQTSCSMGIPQPLNNLNTQPANTTSIKLPNETIIQSSNVITRAPRAKKSLPTKVTNTLLPGVTYSQPSITKSPPLYEMSIQSSNPTNIQSSYFMNTPQTTNALNIEPSYSTNTPQTTNAINIQPSYFTNTPQTSNSISIQPSYSMNTLQTSNAMNIQPSYSINTHQTSNAMNVQPSCPVNIPPPSKRKKTRNVNTQNSNVMNAQSVNTQPSNTMNPHNPVGMNTQFSNMNFLNSTATSNLLNPYSPGVQHAYGMNFQHMTGMNTQPSSATNSKNSNRNNAQYSAMKNSSITNTVNTQLSNVSSSQNLNKMNPQYSTMTNPPTMNTLNTQPSSAFDSQNCNAINSQYSAVVGSINTNTVNKNDVLKSLGPNSLNAQYSAVINSRPRNVVNTQPQYSNTTTSKNSTQLNAQHLATLNSRPSNGINSQSNQSVTNVQQHKIPTNGLNINTYQQYNVYNNVINYTNVNNNTNHNVISGQPNTLSVANYDLTSSSQQSCNSSTASCYSYPSQYPARLVNTQPPTNIAQPSVVATSSSLNGITLDSNHYDPSRTSVIRHPLRTYGATNFRSPDYNSQVSPDLPNTLSPNMPNQQNFNINNKCMASNCTDLSKYTCDNCYNACYCSFKCQGNDWHYHKNECRKQ